MIIAVTGISSGLGKALIPKLQGDPSVERIIGIDVAEYSGNPDKITFIKADVRNMDSMVASLEGVDVLFHLAFIVVPTKLPQHLCNRGSRTDVRCAGVLHKRIQRYAT